MAVLRIPTTNGTIKLKDSISGDMVGSIGIAKNDIPTKIQ
jgi:hypothetical protein